MKKKRNGKKKAIPQKGDPDYLSPTQLRNRRKRRAKQQKNREKDGGIGPTSNDSGKTSEGNKNDGRNDRGGGKDPSMKYISDPASAPTVRAARAYFRPILKECDAGEFRVHVGPLRGWRTAAKLAVRPAPSSSADAAPRVAMGLFLPGSHELLPVPNCRAHHPAINAAVEAATRACREAGVVPYRENGRAEDGGGVGSDGRDDGVERGTGQLRYVAANVARESGAAQVTLVWNGHPPPPAPPGGESENGKKEEGGSKRKREKTIDERIDDPALEKLVAKLVSMSEDDENGRSSAKRESGPPTKASDASSNPADDRRAKKRRRRGRREGGSNPSDASKNEAETGGSDARDDAATSDVAREGSNGGRGRPSRPPKLNLHSLWINYNPSWKHSNAIFSFDPSCWRRVHGPRAVVEHLSFDNARPKSNDGREGTLASPKPPPFPIPLNFPPNVFRQANLDAFQHIVARIRERVITLGGEIGSGVSCVELYGGVGTIGLHLSDVVTSLVSSDENPNNAACFDESVRALPEHIRPKLTYVKKNAADMVKSERDPLRRCHALVVDPPRKGLDAEVVEYLRGEGRKNVKLVVYVSCGFNAFRRDCDALVDGGKWRVEFAEGYVLFPGSDAVETLAFFVPA